jgi:hypothetical protein
VAAQSHDLDCFKHGVIVEVAHRATPWIRIPGRQASLGRAVLPGDRMEVGFDGLGRRIRAFRPADFLFRHDDVGCFEVGIWTGYISGSIAESGQDGVEPLVDR